MESDTPTPLTDEMVDVQRTMGGDEYQVVPADFARRLERRCAELEEGLRRIAIIDDADCHLTARDMIEIARALLEKRDGA